MDVVRKYQDWSGPAVYVVMLALLGWILVQSGGRVSLNISPHLVPPGEAVLKFFTAMALVVAYFSTLMLNFCDFSRFTPSRRTVTLGNFLGLPVNFTAFSVVSVLVTAGTISVFGRAITDPVLIVGKIPNTFVLILGAITFTVATIGINIVANFVSPAYDLANVAPKYINFQRGGIIAAIVSLLVLPWKIYSSPVAINYFLGGLAAFLGPIFGIIIVDYYLFRHQQVDLKGLYETGSQSPYWYDDGFNPKALIAFVPAAAVAALIALVPMFGALAPFSWFIGAAIAAGLYWKLMVRAPSHVITPQASIS